MRGGSGDKDFFSQKVRPCYYTTMFEREIKCRVRGERQNRAIVWATEQASVCEIVREMRVRRTTQRTSVFVL